MGWMLSSAVLTLTVIALRCALRGRISPRTQYALWLLVLVRLLIPVSFGASSLSVMNALPERVQVVRSDTKPLDGGTEATPAAPVQDAAGPDSPDSTRISQPDAMPAAAAPAGGRTAVRWETLAGAVWLAGTAAVGTVFWRQIFTFTARCAAPAGRSNAPERDCWSMRAVPSKRPACSDCSARLFT